MPAVTPVRAVRFAAASTASFCLLDLVKQPTICISASLEQRDHLRIVGARFIGTGYEMPLFMHKHAGDLSYRLDVAAPFTRVACMDKGLRGSFTD